MNAAGGISEGSNDLAPNCGRSFCIERIWIVDGSEIAFRVSQVPKDALHLLGQEIPLTLDPVVSRLGLPTVDATTAPASSLL